MNSEILDRCPPQNLDAEKAVLGSILLEPARLDEVRDILRADDFHAEAHRTIYGHFLAIRNGGGGGIDVALLLDRLNQTGDIKVVGGADGGAAANIAEIMQRACTPSDAKHHAAIVKRAAEQRNIIQAATGILQAAYNGTSPAVLRQRLDAAIDKIDAGTLRYKRLSCAELDRGDYELDYLIENTLVAGQPCIVAGGKKCLKTSLLLDLGISLAVGGFFLGKLPVRRACKVGIMTGESGLATIQETCRRICRAAGYRLGDISGLVFSEDLPRFGSLDHEDALRRFIMDDEVEVLVVDPAYLCLPGADAGNLFVQGDLLRGMSKVCADTGCTMILAHHTRKTKVDPFAPPELEDIAWAGFQEFARQWLLVGRREAYEPGTGEHRLWLSVGGSAGHTALWAVDVSEGTRATEGGRFWNVNVMHADEARDAVEERKEAQKTAKADAAVERDCERIKKALAKYPAGETAKALREAAGINSGRFGVALARLLDRYELVACEINKTCRKTPFDGYKLAE